MALNYGVATYLDDAINSNPASELQCLLIPVRGRLIVDNMCGPEVLHHLEFFVRGRDGDDCSARRDCKLESKAVACRVQLWKRDKGAAYAHRDPARSLYEDRVASLQRRISREQCVIRRHGSASKMYFERLKI